MTETFETNYVENESGFGHFSIAVNEDGRLSEVSNVPAVGMEKAGNGEKYIELQKKSGSPIIAFRNGGRGMCSVIVNEDLIKVDEVNLRIPGNRINIHAPVNQVVTDAIMTTSLPANRFYETLYVSTGARGPKNEFVSSLEIIARTKAGLPYKAVVSFVPSISR